jgi:hypothetical protein
MPDSLSDQLTGTLRTVLVFERVDLKDLGGITNVASVIKDYRLTDGPLTKQADLVYAETRAIPANTMETIDLLDLDQPTLGVAVSFEFRQLRLIRIVNESTTSGQRLLVGASPGSPVSVYAAEIGPGSEWHAVNYLDAWQVTEANKLVRISNPNAATLNYSLYLFGTSTPPPPPPEEEEEEE